MSKRTGPFGIIPPGVPVERGPYPETIEWRHTHETTDNPELFMGWLSDIQASLALVGLSMVSQTTDGRTVWTAAGHKVAELVTTMDGKKGTVYARPIGGQAPSPGIRGRVAAEELRRSSQWLGYGQRTATLRPGGATHVPAEDPTDAPTWESTEVGTVTAVSTATGDVTLRAPTWSAATGKAMPLFPIPEDLYQQALADLKAGKLKYYGGIGLGVLGALGGVATAMMRKSLGTAGTVAAGAASVGGVGGGSLLAVNGKKSQEEAVLVIEQYEMQQDSSRGTSEIEISEEVEVLVPDTDSVQAVAGGSAFRVLPAGEIVNGIESLPGDAKVTIRDLEVPSTTSHFDYDADDIYANVYWDGDRSLLFSNIPREGQLLIRIGVHSNGNVGYGVEGHEGFQRKKGKQAPAFLDGAILANDLIQQGDVGVFANDLFAKIGLTYNYGLCIGDRGGGAQDGFGLALKNYRSPWEVISHWAERTIGILVKIVSAYVGAQAATSTIGEMVFTAAMTGVDALQVLATGGSLSDLKNIGLGLAKKMGLRLFLEYGRDFCINANEKIRAGFLEHLGRESSLYQFANSFYETIQDYKSSLMGTVGGMDIWDELKYIPQSMGVADHGLLERVNDVWREKQALAIQTYEDTIVAYGTSMPAKQLNYIEAMKQKITDKMGRLVNAHEMMIASNLNGMNESFHGYSKTLIDAGAQYDQVRIVLYR